MFSWTKKKIRLRWLVVVLIAPPVLAMGVLGINGCIVQEQSSSINDSLAIDFPDIKLGTVIQDVLVNDMRGKVKNMLIEINPDNKFDGYIKRISELDGMEYNKAISTLGWSSLLPEAIEAVWKEKRRFPELSRIMREDHSVKLYMPIPLRPRTTPSAESVYIVQGNGRFYLAAKNYSVRAH